MFWQLLQLEAALIRQGRAFFLFFLLLGLLEHGADKVLISRTSCLFEGLEA